MANCLKCAQAKEIARLRDICLNCVIGKAECGLSHGGVSFVSMDAAKSPEMVTRGRVAPEYSTRSEPNVKMDTPLGADERERLLLLLAKFAELSWDDAGLICSMLAGKTLDRIAQERKISPQALHARWTKLITRNPIWKALTNGMIGSGRGRKASAGPAQSQMELF